MYPATVERISRLWNVHSLHFSFKTNYARTLALGFAVLGLAVFAQAADGNTNLAQNSTPALGRLVVVGDSLSAGFQNGTLMACQQVNGFANLVATQAGTPLTLPLIGFPGLPPITSAVPPVGRINPFDQATDLAVPGQSVAQALTMAPVYGTPVPPYPFDPAVFPALPPGPPPAGIQTLTNFVLGFPGVFASPQIALSQAQWANALGPNTVVVWIGNNDVIGVFEGVQNSITDPITFAQEFEQLLSSLDSNNRRLIVANLPDATLTPFLSQLLANNLPLRLTVQGVTLAYNAAIFASALRHHAAFVNIYDLVNNLAARGIVVNGVRLTTQAGGGLFSLDGIHPTNTGYAIIANAFIRSINSAFDANIAPVNLGSVAAADPLFPTNVTNPPALCTAP